MNLLTKQEFRQTCKKGDLENAKRMNDQYKFVPEDIQSIFDDRDYRYFWKFGHYSIIEWLQCTFRVFENEEFRLRWERKPFDKK